MNAEEIIRQVSERSSEWLEMTPEPTSMLVGILAQKIVNLNGYVEYLERRLKDESKTSTARYTS